jgi:monooxygenase
MKEQRDVEHDDVEHLDVLIVGAGLSGIGAAHHVQDSCRWATYAIFDARDAIGGTWDLFRYPGIRSDSDMFTFSYPFRPWTGDRSIGDGPAIRQYIEDTAIEDGTDRHIRFHHRVLRADWSTDDARWTVTAERTDTGETFELTCSWLFSCTGYYRYDHGHQPDFPGSEDFAGTIVHPQEWPEDLDYDGKRIVVIGSGATAVTLVPSLAATAAHVTMLQRSPTYIASLPSTNPLTRAIRKVLPRRFHGPVLRWTNALTTQAFYQLSQRRPEFVKRMLRSGVERELPDGFDVDTHFTPRYDPWDQRLCVVPDGDLFRAIRRGTVSVVTDHIDTFTRRGIRLRSGEELDADIIVTATGLELLFIGGIELTIDGEKVDPAQKMAFQGMMLEGVPNFSLAFGYANASWTLRSDLTCGYVARVLNQMRAGGTSTCTPVNRGARAVDESVFGLSSGYIQRSADQLPRQGSKDPWRVHHSYVHDYRRLKRGGIDDALVLTRPAGEASDHRRTRSA